MNGTLTQKSKAVAVLIGCLLIFAASPSLAGKGQTPSGDTTRYDILTLIPPGTDVWESHVGDMNELNDVVGYYRVQRDGPPYPYYYDFLNDDFITLPGTGNVLGLNNQREAVGKSGGVGGSYWASPLAAPSALPPLQAGDSTGGNDINDAGIIIGGSGGSVVVWSVAGGTISQPVALGTLPGDDDATALRLTESDADGSTLIVGRSSRREQIGPDTVIIDSAVVWEVTRDGNGALRVTSGPSSLGTLGGGWSEAYGVNSSGDVCDTSDNWPFLNPAGGDMLPLSGLRNAVSGSASDVNGDAIVVGSLRIQDRWGGISDIRAVLWDAAGVVDLSKAAGKGTGWEKLERAFEINRAGSIAGIGHYPIAGSGTAAYLLIQK